MSKMWPVLLGVEFQFASWIMLEVVRQWGHTIENSNLQIPTISHPFRLVHEWLGDPNLTFLAATCIGVLALALCELVRRKGIVEGPRGAVSIRSWVLVAVLGAQAVLVALFCTTLLAVSLPFF